MKLARHYGIQPSFRNGAGVRQAAPAESVIALLEALGVAAAEGKDWGAALADAEQVENNRLLDPVCVLWQGHPHRVVVRAGAHSRGKLECLVRLEDGGEVEWSEKLDFARTKGGGVAEHIVALPEALPLGYHRLRVKVGRAEAEALLISAPLRATPSPTGQWGGFVPLHALHSANSWGIGDFGDMQDVAGWLDSIGGRYMGMLPLLAGFNLEPFESSPYSPASRLFWNELHLDVARAPEMANCPQAQDLISSHGFQKELADLRGLDLVDHRRCAAAKRRVLELLADSLFASASGRRDAVAAFGPPHSLPADYAAFRANCDKRRVGWPVWPASERDQELPDAVFGGRDFRYHLYSQFLCFEQLKKKKNQSKDAKQASLYLDLPLGVNGAGFDTWRDKDSFSFGASVGAPPDELFPEGQNWGFPPLSPAGIRENGYRYPIACVRHLMSHAGVIRLDHIMALHRLFWVPSGLKVNQGAYVHYRPDEFYAILTLESHLSGTVVVGEDLGTVPVAVRRAMRKHGIYRNYLLQYEGVAAKNRPPKSPPVDCLAAVNAHDMPPLAGFWEASDIPVRVKAGAIDQIVADNESASRPAVKRGIVELIQSTGGLAPGDSDVPRRLTDAAYCFLAGSDAAMMIVNLEDLMLETRSQNVPGTTDNQHPNWRHKSKYSLERLKAAPEVLQLLSNVNRLRSDKSAV